jgi:hypothetical protein
VEELLRSAVDVDSIDLDGRIALHIAAWKGQAEVVRLLLDSKANMNARDRWGSIVRGLIYHYFIHVLSASMCFRNTIALYYSPSVVLCLVQPSAFLFNPPVRLCPTIESIHTLYKAMLHNATIAR